VGCIARGEAIAREGGGCTGLRMVAVQPVEWAVAGCLGSLVVVVLVVLRIYLGWAYVGDRLLSAAVPYEETGWYFHLPL
jgi:hypothetical protein